MRSAVRVAVVLAMTIIVTTPLSAIGEEKEKAKKKGPQVGENLLRQLEGVGLTAEQDQKIKDILAEYTPKFEEARKKVGAAGKMIRETRRKAAAEGKKGKKAWPAVDALDLTAEQREGVVAGRELTLSLRKAVLGVLTDEQIKKMGRKRGGKKKKKEKEQ